MKTPSLRFVEKPYDSNRLHNYLLRFRARGFVVLPDVFERDSVDAFLEEVKSALGKNESGDWHLPDDRSEMVWPIRAPRLLPALQGALSPSRMTPRISVFETAWLIRESQEKRGEWHKDRQQEGMPGQEYHYPLGVHLGIYFLDMEKEDGPTQIIPCSHMDQNLNPYNGSEVEQFTPRKQDVVLWDQRCWHQATPRTKEGLRVFAIFGFESINSFKPYPLQSMPRALARAWLEAEGSEYESYYGGRWGIRSVLEGLKDVMKEGDDS